MEKKKAIENTQKAVTLFFRIRRGFKIFVAFSTGILSAVALYDEIYQISENKWFSFALALLAGAFITTVMLLIMEIIRTCIGKAKKIGTIQFAKYKERKSDHEKNHNAEQKQNRKIKTYVDMMFDDIPYSEEVSSAQSKIETALNQEYEQIKSDRHTDEALEDLIVQHGRLSQMAELAGFPSDSAEKWRNEGEAVNIRALKKQVWKQRIRVYFISLFAAFALLQVFWLVYNLIGNPSSAVGNIIVIAADLVVAAIPFRKYLKTETAGENVKYDTAAFHYLRSGSDRYAKRLLNSIPLLFVLIFIFVFSELIFYVAGNSKSAEFTENAFKNSIAIEIPVFILVKNLLCFRIFQRRIKMPDKQKYHRHIFGITVFSAVYWLGITAVILLLSDKLTYPANVYTFGGLVFGVLLLVYNLTLRRKIMYKNIVVNVPRIAVFTSAAIFGAGFLYLQRDTWYTQSYINSIPVIAHNPSKIEYDEDSGIYTITKTTDDFKILHLTDIHIGGSLYSYPKDMKALYACYAEIAHTHPDLVVVTGDMCFPMGVMSLSLNNSAPVQQFAAFMRNTGIPWAFTYGNHDTESMSTLDKTELNEVYKSLSYKTSGNLLYPYKQPEIMGRNNRVISGYKKTALITQGGLI